MAYQVKAFIVPELKQPKRTKPPFNSFQLTEITTDKIVRIITKLNEKKSTQVNDIPKKFLKYKCLDSTNSHKLILQMYKRRNLSRKLKNAHIIPVYNKNYKYGFTNYRQIAMFSQLSKIFEKKLLND